MEQTETMRRFYEVQHFWQQPLSWFAWLVSGGSLILLNSIGAIHSQFAIIMSIAILGIVILVTFTQLHTEVSQDGIAYRMKPFHRSWRKLARSEIKSAYVRKYSALREFGGWGVRVGMNGRAYNVKGNMGLQLELSDGSKILIGTQRPDELQEILDELGYN